MKLFVVSVIAAIVVAGPPPEYLPDQLPTAGLPTCADAKGAYKSGNCCGNPDSTVYVPEYDGACESIATYGKWRIVRGKLFTRIPALGNMTAADALGSAGARLATWWRGEAKDRVGFKMLYEVYSWNEGAVNVPLENFVNETEWNLKNVAYQEVELFEVAPSCSAMLINSYNNNIENMMPLYNQFMDQAQFTTMIPSKYKDNTNACHALVRDPDGFQQNGSHNGNLINKTLTEFMSFIDNLSPTAQFKNLKIKFTTPLVQVCEK